MQVNESKYRAYFVDIAQMCRLLVFYAYVSTFKHIYSPLRQMKTA